MEDIVIYLNEICDKLIQERIRPEDEVNQLKEYIIKYKQWGTIEYLEDEILNASKTHTQKSMGLSLA